MASTTCHMTWITYIEPYIDFAFFVMMNVAVHDIHTMQVVMQQRIKVIVIHHWQRKPMSGNVSMVSMVWPFRTPLMQSQKVLLLIFVSVGVVQLQVTIWMAAITQQPSSVWSMHLKPGPPSLGPSSLHSYVAMPVMVRMHSSNMSLLSADIAWHKEAFQVEVPDVEEMDDDFKFVIKLSLAKTWRRGGYMINEIQW